MKFTHKSKVFQKRVLKIDIIVCLANTQYSVKLFCINEYFRQRDLNINVIKNYFELQPHNVFT